MLTSEQEEVLAEYLRETPAEEVAYATVSDSSLSVGTYRMMPILCGIMDGQTYPVLYLSAAVLKESGDDHNGVLIWTIPLSEDNFEAAVMILTALGWDGRVWPMEGEGWPSGSTEDMEGINELLMSFELSAGQQFPLPSYPPEGIVVPEHFVEKFHWLVENRVMFGLKASQESVGPVC